MQSEEIRMIPLAVPNLSGNEREYLNRCINTTFVSSVGEYVNELEINVAKVTGASMATATSSGTTALHIALISVGVKRDELVIMPTFTFIATANAVAHCGAMPWLFDIEPVTWTLNAKQVRCALEEETVLQEGRVIHKKTGKRVAAIVPVYTLGAVADMDSFKTISREYGLPIVADAAAALGAEYKNKSLAELADITAFSFNGNKTITAGGGGMVIGNDDTMIRYAKHISTTARISPEYDHDEVGYNYRMTNIQAAVGCAQLEQLEKFVERKRQIRQYYDDAFRNTKGIDTFSESPWGRSACWFSGIVLRDKELPTVQDMCKLLRQDDIEARSFWKPVHLQRPYADAVKTENFDIADSTWNRILTLPCSTGISDEELEQVAIAVRKVL